mgnify:CR=1 FL=1
MKWLPRHAGRSGPAGSAGPGQALGGFAPATPTAERAAPALADAQQQADKTRGEGDAERNRIFAEAYGKDPDFFAFYRSMEAYKSTFKDNNRTTLVLSPESEFLRYLKQR